MKSKAKPVKGSARTKRFDVGGTVGALAGLGTLAYLMSRKKKGADGEYKPQGKFPSEDGSGTSGPGMGDTTTKVDDAGRQRAMAASMGRPEMGDADSESDKALVRTDRKVPPAVNQGGKKKPASTTTTTTSAAKAKTGQGSRTITGVDAGIAAGQQKKQALTSKPYPSASEQAAAKKDTADKLAALKKANEEKKKDVVTSVKDRGATTLEKGTGTKTEGKKYGIGPYGAFSGIHRALSDTRSEEEKQKSADAIFNATRGKAQNKKAGGSVKKYAAGGSVKASGMGSVKTAKPSMGSASKRADGIAQRGKTRGKVC